MPIPWAAAARAIPWGDVITAAPKLVRNARELLRRSSGPSEPPEPAEPAAAGPTPEEEIARLEERLRKLEGELAASSELIARLAEQNERLVVAIDRLNRHLGIASVIAGAAILGAIAALLLPMGH